MNKYHVSAMVFYDDEVYADSEDEAKDKFCLMCHYDLDTQTLEVEREEDDEGDKAE